MVCKWLRRSPIGVNSDSVSKKWKAALKQCSSVRVWASEGIENDDRQIGDSVHPAQAKKFNALIINLHQLPQSSAKFCEHKREDIKDKHLVDTNSSKAIGEIGNKPGTSEKAVLVENVDVLSTGFVPMSPMPCRFSCSTFFVMP